MLLTGPFGGLTDDVREFLLCLADDSLPLTGWGDLDPPDAAQLGFVFAAWWEGSTGTTGHPRTELGRLLWHERDSLLQELARLPPGQVELAGFARRFRALIGHHWPPSLAAATQN